jgi:hypothetical protein
MVISNPASAVNSGLVYGGLIVPSMTCAARNSQSAPFTPRLMSYLQATYHCCLPPRVRGDLCAAPLRAWWAIFDPLYYLAVLGRIPAALDHANV